MLFESMLEITPTAVVTLDVARRVTAWNRAAVELFGYSAAKAIGRKLEDLVANHEDLRAETIASFDQLDKGERIRAVTRRTRKDGTFVDVDFFAISTTVEDEHTGYFVIHYDLSALKEAEKRYRDLIEQLPLVTYMDEPAIAPSIYISPQVEALLGYTADEWLADPELFIKLLHPDDRGRVVADHERVFAAGESSWSFEYRLIARDGHTVWLRDDAVVVKDDQEKPLYVQGFLMDITKRKEAEVALRKSEERFRAMFAEAPIGVAWGPLDDSGPRPISGGAGSSLYTRNRAYTEMLGYTEDELASDALHRVHASRRSPEGPRVVRRADRRRAPTLRGRHALHRQGRPGHLGADSRGSAERGGGASRLGLTMVQDITERRRAHDALKESEAELRRQKQYWESLLELSPAAIVTTNMDDEIAVWNAAAEELFGYSQAGRSAATSTS